MPALRQIAYLSTQPDHLADTTAYVRHFMPWITDTVVVTPAKMVDAMLELNPDVRILVDEDLLPPGMLSADLDHQTRNFQLRLGMCLSGALDDVFVCSDDDYRPIKHIAPETFVRPGPDGRDQLVGYTFYDLENWSYRTSEFDMGQHNTLQLLAYLGAEQRSYASHMPQAIDRELFVQAAGVAARLAPGVPVDEWAIHYNLGRHLDPGRFTPPEPYMTLGWPEYPNLWRRAVIPREYAFENFYPRLYRDGFVYEGLSTTFDAATVEQEAVEKLIRWRQLDISVRRLELPPDVYLPGRGSARKFKALRAIKRNLDHVLFSERANRHDDPFG